MRTLVIGDIQSCYAELHDLIDAAGLASDDEIIALGDFVDRGPDSPEVFDFIVSRPNVRSIMGNHERKHVRSFYGRVRPALSQVITRLQFGEDRYPDAVARMAELPRYLELPEAILVHAFFEPGVPLAEQREVVIVGTLSGEGYLRQRYDRPWYELYGGPKPILVGHHNYLGKAEPLVYEDRVFGLDTGCCNGGRLTGLVLPEFRLVSVPSRGDHWTNTKRWYEDLRAERLPDEALTWELAARFLSSAASRGALSASEHARVDRVAALLADGEKAIETVLDHVTRENERVLADLRASVAFDALPPPEQGSLYARHIGKTPLAKFLHLFRKQLLTADSLKVRFDKPASAIAFVKRAGFGRSGPVAPGSPDN